LRLKGRCPPYAKTQVLNELEKEFHIKRDVWEKIWLAKAKRISLTAPEIEPLFDSFLQEVERLISFVDKL